MWTPFLLSIRGGSPVLLTTFRTTLYNSPHAFDKDKRKDSIRRRVKRLAPQVFQLRQIPPFGQQNTSFLGKNGLLSKDNDPPFTDNALFSFDTTNTRGDMNYESKI